MKVHYPILLFFLVGELNVSCAQSTKNVPQAVMHAFTDQFEGASKVKWQLEDGKDWEAEFLQNGQEMSATYSSEGQWQETETEVEVDELPQTVRSTLHAQYEEFKIRESAIVRRPELQKAYEVELKNGKEVFEVLLDEKGTVLSTSKESSGKEKN